MLGNLPVPGRLTFFNNGRAMPAVFAVGVGCLYIFLSSIISLFFLPLSGRCPIQIKNTVSKVF